MKKRLAAILLAVMLVLTVMPITAFAGSETVYPLWISGIQVTESNKADVLGNADGSAKTVSFDSKTNTLTLNGANLSMSGSASGHNHFDSVCGVKTTLASLTVNLVGKNQIGKETNRQSALGDYSADFGFFSKGNISFAGNGSVAVYDYCAGVSAMNVTFTEKFKGKFTVRDSGGAEPQPPCAIFAEGKFDDVTYEYVSDGNINILGGTFDLISFESNGIVGFGNVNINNSNVTIDSANGAIESEHGDITVKNTTITAVGDCAINSYKGNILIDNVTLRAAGDGREAITAENVTIKNCPKVDVLGGDEAILAKKKASFINCPAVRMESNELNTVSADEILIENSTLDITANNGYRGLVAIADDEGEKGSVTVKDSKIKINAEGDGIKCSNLSVSGGKTEVYSIGDTDKNGKGCGALILGDESAISITDATVMFTGGEAGIKLQKSGNLNPFKGDLPKAKFSGNKAFDTFNSLKKVTYNSELNAGAYNEFAYVDGEIAKSVAIIHTHNLVKVNGVMPTTKRAGYRSYYMCNCGKFFEDKDGKTEITDIEKWKAKGGNGYLAKLTSDKSPLTGNTNGIVLLVFLMSFAFAGLVFCSIRKKCKSR